MKIQKKKKDKPAIKQVFDWLDMPHEFNGDESTIIIAGKRGADNDSYYRWYPDDIAKKEIGKYEDFETEKDWESAKLLNDWLLEHGMIIKDEFCFHVLIHVGW